MTTQAFDNGLFFWSNCKFESNFYFRPWVRWPFSVLNLLYRTKLCAESLKRKSLAWERGYKFYCPDFPMMSIAIYYSTLAADMHLNLFHFRAKRATICATSYSFLKTGKKEKRTRSGEICSGLSSHNLFLGENANAKSRRWPKSFIHSSEYFCCSHWACNTQCFNKRTICFKSMKYMSKNRNNNFFEHFRMDECIFQSIKLQKHQSDVLKP